MRLRSEAPSLQPGPPIQLRLYGHPVAHSKSPAFQSAGLRSIGWEGVYLAEDVDLQGLQDAARAVRSGDLWGANITLPYKRDALALADRVTRIAREAGAANTWWRDEGGLLCATNTDVAGVLAAIEAISPVVPREVVILGAGGAAAATARALAGRADRVTLINRSVKRAQEVALRLFREGSPTQFNAIRWPDRVTDPDVTDVFTRADVVIQATSLPYGEPRVAKRAYAKLPWAALGHAASVLDLAYTSKATEVVRIALDHHLPAADGATMLLYQGAVSFQIWTGVEAPLESMRDALVKALGRTKRAIPVRSPHLSPALVEEAVR